MDRSLENIAILEIFESHHECIYSQVQFLKNHYNIFLLCNENLREYVSHFDGLTDLKLVDTYSVGFYCWLKKFLKRRAIKKVIINTATGKEVQGLVIKFLFSSIKFYGVLHNTHKLSNSNSQKIISLKVRKYFILAEYLYQQLNNNEKEKVCVFYPIYFPRLQELPIIPKCNDFWAVIPGGFDFKRRNYIGLLDELKKNYINPKLKIIILGKTSEKNADFVTFRNQLKKSGILPHFIFFNTYLSNPDFYSYLYNADIILPLIDTETKGRRYNYTNYQASGSFGLAFGLQIPMIIEEHFEKYREFKELSIIYKKGELLKEIHELIEYPGVLLMMKLLIKNYPCFDLEFQRRKYLEHLK